MWEVGPRPILSMTETQIPTAETKITSWFCQKCRTNVTFQLRKIIVTMQYRYILCIWRDKRRSFALCHHQSDKVQRSELGHQCQACKVKFVTSVMPSIPSKWDFSTIREQMHKILVCMYKEMAGGKRTIAQTLWTVHWKCFRRYEGNENFPVIWET